MMLATTANQALPALAADAVRSLKETAELSGISVATLRRMIAAGEGPRVTRLSERRLGIRDSHRLAWLDSRADPAVA